MTAVIYARYSSDNQREESIEGQIRECTAYAEKNGITVVKHNHKCGVCTFPSGRHGEERTGAHFLGNCQRPQTIAACTQGC